MQVGVALSLHWLDVPQTPRLARNAQSSFGMIARVLGISAFLLVSGAVAGRDGDYLLCSDAELVVYTLTFETFWTRHNFPKQYPEYRPPAHWSKLIGMTHDDQYKLFRIGEPANKALKIFAETGKTDLFATVDHTFDEFYSPSIKTGAGKARVNFFADGNHTMVSLAAKLIPSPDWFVGLDSLVLCDRGKWIDTLTVEGNPMDAGTDSGYTFTAPNWETDPPENISRITSKYPTHPANSFYYPMLQGLPPIATFQIKKEKLYHLVKTRENGESVQARTSPERAQETTVPTTVHQDPKPGDNGFAAAKKIFIRKKSYPRRKMKKPRIKKMRCRLEKWSQWSRCNVTCGKGYATRIRESVLPLGKGCPTVTEEKQCSDYSGCYGRYFEWQTPFKK